MVDAGAGHSKPCSCGFPVPVTVADEFFRSHPPNGIGACHPDKTILQNGTSPTRSRIGVPLHREVVDSALMPLPAFRHNELELRVLTLACLVIGHDDVGDAGVCRHLASALDSDHRRVWHL